MKWKLIFTVGEGTSELGIVVFDSVFDDLIDQLMGLWVAGSLNSQWLRLINSILSANVRLTQTNSEIEFI